eukprot:GEMP01056808.1.p1 GENE.GEMP01056808.1~~GEMP01056808.1.p1  ORF type:complete len:119 (-),score=0.17 GEMP01056808.1:816-1172(-)
MKRDKQTKNANGSTSLSRTFVCSYNNKITMGGGRQCPNKLGKSDATFGLCVICIPPKWGGVVYAPMCDYFDNMFFCFRGHLQKQRIKQKKDMIFHILGNKKETKQSVFYWFLETNPPD